MLPIGASSAENVGAYATHDGCVLAAVIPADVANNASVNPTTQQAFPSSSHSAPAFITPSDVSSSSQPSQGSLQVQTQFHEAVAELPRDEHEIPLRPLFACPIEKAADNRQPPTKSKCDGCEEEIMSRVHTHLLRKHGLDVRYHQRCQMYVYGKDQLEEHSLDCRSTAKSLERRRTKGKRARKRSTKETSAIVQWCRLFWFLNPGEQLPPSPYVPSANTTEEFSYPDIVSLGSHGTLATMQTPPMAIETASPNQATQSEAVSPDFGTFTRSFSNGTYAFNFT